MAMARAQMSISGLGDSAAGLFVILSSGITTAAYNLGGMSWLIVHVVEMEKFFILGAGGKASPYPHLIITQSSPNQP